MLVIVLYELFDSFLFDNSEVIHYDLIIKYRLALINLKQIYE